MYRLSPYPWRTDSIVERHPTLSISPPAKGSDWVAWSEDSYLTTHSGNRAENQVAMVDTIENVRERCHELGWTIERSKPLEQCFNDAFIAVVLDQDDAIIGVTTSSSSNLRTLLAAYQEA